MKERRLAITKRMSLADVAEDWTSECYALYRPATYKDMLEVKSLNPDSLDESAGIDFMLEFASRHIVGGKVMVLNDDDMLQVAEMQPSDVELLPPEVVNSLFADMTGAKLDPKDTRSAVPTDLSQPPAGPATETPSSTT